MATTDAIEPKAARHLSHAAQVRSARKSAPFSASSKTENLSVLVLDDEFLIALQMAQLMENLGWSIIGPAGTIEEADALLKECGAPDAAILDVNIHGTKVFDLAETLHDNGVPILFCSGYDMIDEADRFDGCAKLRKPFGFGDIFSEITALMERKNATYA